MSWSHCGEDSQGRAIGYAHQAKCDHPDCNNDIDRGLSYACGDMHGATEIGCEKYFCEDHRSNTVEDHGDFVCVCDECSALLVESGNWVVNESEGIIQRQKEEPYSEDEL